MGYKWGYTLYLTLFVSICYAVADEYFIVYPKSPTAQQRFGRNKSRITANQIIYDNLRFVVGMSWFDSIVITMKAVELSYGATTAIYWAVAVGGIWLSVSGTHYIKKWSVRNKIAHRGIAQTLFAHFERLYDPKYKLHEQDDEDMIPQIVDGTMFQFINVTVEGLGIAGSLRYFVSNFVWKCTGHDD